MIEFLFVSKERKFLKPLIRLSLAASLVAGVDDVPFKIPPPPPRIEIVTMVEKQTDPTILLNEILSAPLFTSERTRLERQYLGFVGKNPAVENIDRGFMVISNPTLRASLLDARWELRQEGKGGLEPLPDEKYTWAKENGINPEILAI